MIGFKTTESYTFDDCVKYLDSHKDGSELFNEILNRYNTLFTQLQKDDDELFNNCRSVQDYEKYLSRFSVSGYMLYQPKHKNDAIKRINQLKIIQDKQRKNNKKFNVIGLLFGLLIGVLSQRFLPYIVASLIEGNSADWGILGFPISYGIIFLILIIIRIIKKNIFYNRFIAFFGGMVISCIPMYFYLVHNETVYGRFSDYAIFYGGRNGRVGIADSFGNSLIERNYDCFYESSNYIIGIIDNSGSLKIDWYNNKNFILTKSKSYWIVEDIATSNSLKETIESDDNDIINSWRFNNINVVTRSGKELLCPFNPYHNSWRDPDILDLRVIEK